MFKENLKVELGLSIRKGKMEHVGDVCEAKGFIVKDGKRTEVNNEFFVKTDTYEEIIETLSDALRGIAFIKGVSEEEIMKRE